jgi:hypothetical protein
MNELGDPLGEQRELLHDLIDLPAAGRPARIPGRVRRADAAQRGGIHHLAGRRTNAAWERGHLAC